MKKDFVIFILILAVVILGYNYFGLKMKNEQANDLVNLDIKPVPKIEDLPSGEVNIPELPMSLSSPAFHDGQVLPKEFTCKGNKTNPWLRIGGVPIKAKEMALVVEYLDEEKKSWYNWVVWGLKPQDQEILPNLLPEGAIQGLNSYDSSDYKAPCPSSGSHDYAFKIFALDENLNLPTSTKGEDLVKAMEGHILDTTQIIGKVSK